MKIDRSKLIIVIALITGFLSTYYEFSQLIWNDIFAADKLDYLIAAVQFLFFFSLSGILICVNTQKYKNYEHAKHIAFSLLVVAAFSGLALLFDPVIRSSNSAHEDIYQGYFEESGQNIWEDWDKKKRSYYFHDPGIDWIEKSFLLFFYIFTISRIYNIAIKKSDLERAYEQLKSESLQCRLNALNNQITPHFFFNALNALHALILEDKDKALKYLSDISDMFRYILQSKEHNLVSLEQELIFLETFRYMLLVRFENKLHFSIHIDKKYHTCKIPVLSFLPVIENVIKHNELSNRHPMTIDVFIDRGTVVVKNRKKEKLDNIESGKIGLSNLNNRFKILTQREIKIENTRFFFEVRMPLAENL